ALMPRPPADSLRERIYPRSSKASLSTVTFRSTAGLIVSVRIKYPVYRMIFWRMGNRTHWQAYAALFAVYFFWGTTYLGIRMSLEAMTPALLIAIRFTISGAILLIASYLYGVKIPSGKELWRTALYGVMSLG